MLRVLLAAVLLLQTTASGGKLDSSAWVMRASAPSLIERECTDYSDRFWSVSVVDGTPQAKTIRAQTHVVPFHSPTRKILTDKVIDTWCPFRVVG